MWGQTWRCGRLFSGEKFGLQWGQKITHIHDTHTQTWSTWNTQPKKKSSPAVWKSAEVRLFILLMNVSCCGSLLCSSFYYHSIRSIFLFIFQETSSHLHPSNQTRPACFPICHFTPNIFYKPQFSMCLNVKSLCSTALLCFFPLNKCLQFVHTFLFCRSFQFFKCSVYFLCISPL